MNLSIHLPRVLRAGLAIAVTGLAITTHAQSDKPITMVVAYPAGGPADVSTRIVLPAMQKALGQTLVVENLGGASGSIGAQKARDARTDGQIIMAGTPLELIQTPMTLKTRYASEDFRMVGHIASANIMLVTRPNLPVKSAAELVELAKKASGTEMTFGSTGRGSIYHLVAERFAQDTGIKMLNVPYKGAAQMFGDLVGGQIDMVFMPLGGPVAGMIQTGKLKAVAYAGASRHPLFPNIPTMNETGLVKDFVFDAWVGVQVLKGTPEPVAQRLNAALSEAMNQPSVRRELEAAGVIPAQPMTLAEADRFYAVEIARYRAIGNAINLRPE